MSTDTAKHHTSANLTPPPSKKKTTKQTKKQNLHYQWCISDTDGGDVQQCQNKSREVNSKAVNVDLSFHDPCFMRMDMSTSCAFRPLLTFFSFLFFRRKIPKAPSALLTINQKNGNENNEFSFAVGSQTVALFSTTGEKKRANLADFEYVLFYSLNHWHLLL